jgi:hypothetical protein
MYSPTLLDRVRVIGRDGIFLVIRADQPFTFGNAAMQDVPFGMIEQWEFESLVLNLWRC